MNNEYLMEEVIKYFKSLEARIAAVESRYAALEEQFAALRNEFGAMKGHIDEMKSGQQEIQSKLVAVVGHLNRMNEILEEAQLRGLEPEEEPEVIAEPEPIVEETAMEEPENPAVPENPEPAVEEQASPKAAIYGKAVDDIRLAISLGDRFLYQRELFGQKAELMQRTLDELNKLGSFDEALRYINSKFDWDAESNTYQQFLVTLHRRFG